ncbi:cupin domain-containing protein [Acidithiobacillus thiooxidans]|uniref:cupin domain-containing protein n=1 Tax=Acidithiobacillus thiooxidans TaxID=930 RepID=UPI0028552D3E|nr:cupin domain-containing protein [Acidithiobacillus thiooxidans]MDR7926878.1 cupin domain-containing protein [Acidithiobacillus thiooxidans]
MSTQKIIHQLDLQPHPEGGWYRRNFTSPEMIPTPQGDRPTLTSIYYMLAENQLSRWHVIPSTELWHFYKGAPLELFIYHTETRHLQKHILGNKLEAGQNLQVIVPGKAWQCARSIGDFSLMGCTVTPGFDFKDFQFVLDIPDHTQHFHGEMTGLRHYL